MWRGCFWALARGARSMTEFRRLLRDGLGDRFVVAPEHEVLLELHYDLLLRWAPRLNLTALRDAKAVVERHFCEGVALGVSLPRGPLSVLDVGSGAGFPGIPLAVVRPECSVVLVEADAKKAVFLREAAASVRNVRVVRERAERLDGKFDWVVSRAVGWAALRPVVVRVGKGVAVLTSASLASGILEDRCFDWQPLVALPWPGSGVIVRGTLLVVS